jgi:RimJ/RimL family protein N-acetyltransferase
MLRGERVLLTTFDPANAETARAWVNDPETHRFMLSGQEYVTEEAERAFFEDTEKARAAGTAHRFEVHDVESGVLIGVAGLEGVSGYHRHAELGIMIGDPAYRGRGFGADTLRTLLRFGFDELGLHSLRICVFRGNDRAYELYRRVGFTETGCDRQTCLISGEMRDLIRLDMLEDEWRALQA